MEICQHCEMYMKPFITTGKTADCEFCGEIIAIMTNGKWEKTEKVLINEKK